MALKLPYARERNAIVFMAEDEKEASKVFKWAKKMADGRGPLNGVSVVLVPDEMKKGEMGDYAAQAHDFNTDSTLIIATSPEVTVKKGILKGNESVALAKVVGIPGLQTLSESEIWSAGHDTSIELDMGQKVVAAAQKALGSSAAKGGTLGVTNTNEHEESPDKNRDRRWSTRKTHTGEERGDGELNDWALRRRRSEDGSKGGGSGYGTR